MKRKVVIEIRGGTFVGLYSSDPNIEAYLVDWDEIEEDPLNAASRSEPDPLAAMPRDTRAMVAKASSRS